MLDRVELDPGDVRHNICIVEPAKAAWVPTIESGVKPVSVLVSFFPLSFLFVSASFDLPAFGPLYAYSNCYIQEVHFRPRQLPSRGIVVAQLEPVFVFFSRVK